MGGGGVMILECSSLYLHGSGTNLPMVVGFSLDLTFFSTDLDFSSLEKD